MKKVFTKRLAAAVLSASLGAAAFFAPAAGMEALAAPAYKSHFTQTFSWEDTIEPELLVETDENMIYRQLRLCMLYRVIPEGDIWDLNQARTVKMPLTVMTRLYNEGLISGYLYKKFSGEIWNAEDLSAVFDPVYYYNAQKGRLAGVIDPGDVNALTIDFIVNGMPNGYQGSASFDPHFYRSNYKDLDTRYGDNWFLYYNHYILYGMYEMRDPAAKAE
ncbi:MAG: hypothetical protein PUD05_06350 [Lachnospiraceae bacterium]|jgi:hypothetical protein|nr:hypothetical protein [Lachnospiraceae bacterium]